MWHRRFCHWLCIASVQFSAMFVLLRGWTLTPSCGQDDCTDKLSKMYSAEHCFALNLFQFCFFPVCFPFAIKLHQGTHFSFTEHPPA